MFVTQGTLRYYNDYCVTYIPREIATYYLALLPKALYVQSQAHPPHVTVIRKQIEVAPTHNVAWGKYQNAAIPIYYEGGIQTDGTYYWLEAYSPLLNLIRQELGLHPYRFPFYCFHITIGNTKNEL